MGRTYREAIKIGDACNVLVDSPRSVVGEYEVASRSMTRA